MKPTNLALLRSLKLLLARHEATLFVTPFHDGIHLRAEGEQFHLGYLHEGKSDQLDQLTKRQSPKKDCKSCTKNA